MIHLEMYQIKADIVVVWIKVKTFHMNYDLIMDQHLAYCIPNFQNGLTLQSQHTSPELANFVR